MNSFKKAIFALSIIAVFVGIITCAIFRPIEEPAKREVLYEEEPEENNLRIVTKVDGVSGSRFFVQSPKISALTNVISVKKFGAFPSRPDNSAVLNMAFAYCAQRPGTRLVFEKDAVYYVSDALILKDIKDVCIDGNGAKIVSDYKHGLVNIENCECLEIRNLSFDWDWDKLPLGALARAVDVEGQYNTIDFVFDVPEYAREEMLYAISQCDEESGTYGAKGTMIETYDGQNPKVIKSVTKVGDDTLRVVHNGSLTRFGGKKFILRSTAYGGSLFNISNCHDFTMDGLNLYGGTGMGIVIGDKSSHFILRNIFIGPDPKYADVRCISLDADAVHILDADGCFLIEGCDFSRQGDDDVNINSGIGIIRKVKGKTIEFSADGSMSTEPGDIIAFRDKKFKQLRYNAIVEKCERLGPKLRRVTFRDDLPSAIKKNCMLYNKNCTGGNYVIRNNYFHEHRARGLLLQTSDGLVENNVFYKISHDAIRIVMDISTGEWNEGTGADNIEIRNNTIIECGLIGTEVIEIGTHIDGKTGQAYAFTNIRITNNEFRDICGNLMAINNVNNFVFTNNTITIGTLFDHDLGQGRSYLMRSCANVDLSDNTYTDVPNLSLTRLVRSDNPFVWARANNNVFFGKGDKK